MDQGEPGEKEYQGPKRRYGEPEWRNGGLVLDGPGWMGSVQITGQYVLAILALLAVVVSGAGVVYFSYKSNLATQEIMRAQVDLISEVRKKADMEHGEIVGVISDLTHELQQLQCLQTLGTEAARREAKRYGDVCAFLGFPTHQRAPSRSRNYQ